MSQSQPQPNASDAAAQNVMPMNSSTALRTNVERKNRMEENLRRRQRVKSHKFKIAILTAILLALSIAVYIIQKQLIKSGNATFREYDEAAQKQEQKLQDYLALLSASKSVPENNTAAANVIKQYFSKYLKDANNPQAEEKAFKTLRVMLRTIRQERGLNLDQMGIITNRIINWTHALPTTIRSQSPFCRADYAFAVAQAIQTAIFIQKGAQLQLAKPIKLSAQEIMDCCEECTPCSFNLSNTARAFEYVMKHGLSLEEDYPMTRTREECKASLVNASRKYHIESYQNVTKFREIALALKQHPLVVTVDDRNFDEAGPDTSMANCGLKPTRHVLLAGKDTQNWFIRNSKGRWFGKAGQLKIQLLCQCGICDHGSTPIIGNAVQPHL